MGRIAADKCRPVRVRGNDVPGPVEDRQNERVRGNRRIDLRREVLNLTRMAAVIMLFEPMLMGVGQRPQQREQIDQGAREGGPPHPFILFQVKHL